MHQRFVVVLQTLVLFGGGRRRLLFLPFCCAETALRDLVLVKNVNIVIQVGFFLVQLLHFTIKVDFDLCSDLLF